LNYSIPQESIALNVPRSRQILNFKGIRVSQPLIDPSHGRIHWQAHPPPYERKFSQNSPLLDHVHLSPNPIHIDLSSSELPKPTHPLAPRRTRHPVQPRAPLPPEIRAQARPLTARTLRNTPYGQSPPTCKLSRFLSQYLAGYGQGRTLWPQSFFRPVQSP
jgi:hypothetical protein